MCGRISILAVCFLCCLTQSVESADLVQLNVTDSTGIVRVNEPVTSGIPLPRALNLTDTAGLRLVDGLGVAVPAQFTVTARWGGTPADTTKPIKWLLLDFQVSHLAANANATYILQDSGENDFINGNMLSYFCKGLGWYAEMLDDFGRADTYNAKSNLVAYQTFLMNYVWVAQDDLGYGDRGGYPYRWYFNNSPLNKQDIDTSNWMQLSADTNALAYLFSGNEAF
jgi:hypothetical protein